MQGALLGAMMVTKFQIEAMTRYWYPWTNERDFGLYCRRISEGTHWLVLTIFPEARNLLNFLLRWRQYVSNKWLKRSRVLYLEMLVPLIYMAGLISWQCLVAFAEVLRRCHRPQDLWDLRKRYIRSSGSMGCLHQYFQQLRMPTSRERIDVPPQQAREVLPKSISLEKIYWKKKVCRKRSSRMS